KKKFNRGLFGQSLSKYQTHHFLKQHAIRRDRIPTIRSPHAAPVSKCAASLLHDRQQGRTVPQIHHRIDHHVCPASRDQNITITVTPRPAHLRTRLQQLSRIHKARRQQQRILKLSSRRNTRGLAIQETSESLRSRDDLAKRRHVHDANPQLTFDLDCNQNSIQRNAMHKRKRPVDRIEYPAPARVTSRLTFFFTQNPIIRKMRFDALPQVTLRLSISNRDETTVRLPACLRLFAKVLQRDLARTARNLHRKLEQIVKLGFHCDPFFSTRVPVRRQRDSRHARPAKRARDTRGLLFRHSPARRHHSSRR